MNDWQKKYMSKLLEELTEKRYSGMSIVDLYLDNAAKYLELVKSGTVDKSVKNFFGLWGNSLTHNMEGVNPKFRKLILASEVEKYSKALADLKKVREYRKNQASKKNAYKAKRNAINKKKALEYRETHKEEIEEYERKLKEKKARKEAQKNEENKPVEKPPEKKSKSRNIIDSTSPTGRITVADFVVHSNSFRCMHSGHKLENITAVINVMGKRNKMDVLRVSAGYCAKCNTYFILETDFDRIKRYGVLFCRMADYRTYSNNSHSSGDMKLASESILMQYGYNVSQVNNLSSIQRQSILSMLIDSNIMTKSEINSYLSFFIRQRQSQHDRYEVAIKKWTEDRRFVSGYREGEFRRVFANSIITKHNK